MPKKNKISPAQRKDWLNRYEHGERQDVIAEKDDVNPRTVRVQIERARIERAFEAAQQEQLGIALRDHQDDMLDLLKRTRMGIEVPSLDIYFGFGEPVDSPDREFTIPPEASEGYAVTVIIHGGQPAGIRQAEEESRLWRPLKQHLGNKNPLWRHIADWQRALLKEVQARATLCHVIKKRIEVTYDLPVLVQSKEQQPHLTTAIIRLTQTEVANRSLGEPPSDFPARLEVSGGSLNDPKTASYLTEYVSEPEKVNDALPEAIQDMVDSAEARNMARVHQELIDCTRKTRDELEDYLLLHHIPGRCNLCKKLGGQ
jgi:hypothetical protein